MYRQVLCTSLKPFLTHPLFLAPESHFYFEVVTSELTTPMSNDKGVSNRLPWIVS